MFTAKFNCWDKENHVMLTWDTICSTPLSLEQVFNNPALIPLPHIGSNDSKGNPIVQGDVCLLDNRDIGGRRCIGEITYCTDLTLYQNPCFALWTPRGFAPSLLGHLEVLGNIYETPDWADRFKHLLTVPEQPAT